MYFAGHLIALFRTTMLLAVSLDGRLLSTSTPLTVRLSRTKQRPADRRRHGRHLQCDERRDIDDLGKV